MRSLALAQQLAVTAELCGMTLTPAASEVLVAELAEFPEAAVLASLKRCRREVRGRLSLSDIIDRIDDGRPTADEAWAQVGSDDEARTIVSTNEAMGALGEVRLLLQDDPVAARRSFIDAYKRIVGDNRAAGCQPEWFASLGHDKTGRRPPLLEAVRRGRLSAQVASGLLGEPIQADQARALPPVKADRRFLELAATLAVQKALPPAPGEPEINKAQRHDLDIRKQVARLGQELANTTDGAARRALLEQIHALTVARAVAQEVKTI